MSTLRWATVPGMLTVSASCGLCELEFAPDNLPGVVTRNVRARTAM